MSFHVCNRRRHRLGPLCLSFIVLFAQPFVSALLAEQRTYPGPIWEAKNPSEVGLNPRSIDEIRELLEGRGCIVRHGYVIKTWGSQSQKGDWLSSSKPVFSTLLFFAVQEGRLDSVHTAIGRFGWELCPKDETMTFHHLANMISGYARPEEPGAAWAYNDYAINLYRLTLFDRLFQGTPAAVPNDPQRLGPLQFEDGLSFWEMTPQDERLSGEAGDGEVFALPGEIYAVYLPRGGRATLDLAGCPGNFTTRWYNPREGVFRGDTGRLSGGRPVDLPAPPQEPTEDWTLLVTRERARRTTNR